MASAAAVSADIDRPPVDHDFDESNGVTSTVTAEKPEEDDDDEDDDIQKKGRRQDRVMNNADEDQDAEDDDDLFGDGGDDEELPEEPTAEYVPHHLFHSSQSLTVAQATSARTR